MKKLLSLSLATTLSFAAAYKIPEQSARSVGLAGAYIAGAKSADAAYFNPANMSFMSDGNFMEMSFTGAMLPKVEFDGQQVTNPGPPPTLIPASAKSDSQKYLIPHLHFVGPKFGSWRFGISLTTPAGFAKKWQRPPQTWSAKEFTLRTAQVMPSISYQINENFSIGAGVRVLMTDGKIRFDHPVKGSYDMDGDIQTHYGFLLSASYKLKELTLATTFKNRIDLKEKGDVLYNGSVKTVGHTKVPLPATLALAASLDINEKATVELVYERTFWSDYKQLIMRFDDPTVPTIVSDKYWDDTNTFRLGLTYHNSSKLTTLYGIAYDETPVPAKTLGYELPDSDALIFSAGAIYEIVENLNLGISYLLDYKLGRTLSLGENKNGIVGTFKSGPGAHLLNLSLNYRF